MVVFFLGLVLVRGENKSGTEGLNHDMLYAMKEKSLISYKVGRFRDNYHGSAG